MKATPSDETFTVFIVDETMGSSGDYPGGCSLRDTKPNLSRRQCMMRRRIALRREH